MQGSGLQRTTPNPRLICVSPEYAVILGGWEGSDRVWAKALHQVPLRGAGTKTANKTMMTTQHTVGDGKLKIAIL